MRYTDTKKSPLILVQVLCITGLLIRVKGQFLIKFFIYPFFITRFNASIQYHYSSSPFFFNPLPTIIKMTKSDHIVSMIFNTILLTE